MRLLNWLMDRLNPTRNWQSDSKIELILDLDTNRLCGVGLGDSFGNLQKLGPVEDITASRQGQFRYYSRGLDIDSSKDVVDSFSVHWSSSVHGEFLPYLGKVIYKGREVELDHNTLIDQICYVV